MNFQCNGRRSSMLLPLSDGPRITLHCAAAKCGASTLACRVGTPADAPASGPQKRRVETRRGTQKCVCHDSRCEVILALLLSCRIAVELGADGVGEVVVAAAA